MVLNIFWGEIKLHAISGKKESLIIQAKVQVSKIFFLQRRKKKELGSPVKDTIKQRKEKG